MESSRVRRFLPLSINGELKRYCLGGARGEACRRKAVWLSNEVMLNLGIFDDLSLRMQRLYSVSKKMSMILTFQAVVKWIQCCVRLP